LVGINLNFRRQFHGLNSINFRNFSDWHNWPPHSIVDSTADAILSPQPICSSPLLTMTRVHPAAYFATSFATSSVVFFPPMS
jgi:hypothetical protein